jgi:hypothetical protein
MQEQISISWRFWLVWGLAFLAFPIGGLAATAIVGPVTNMIQGLLAGAVTGIVLGLIQGFVLKGALPLSILGWVIATGVGMSIGLGSSVGLLGSEVNGNNLLWRAVITGLCIGVAQWFILRNIFSQSFIWIIVLALAWTAGWFVTRSAGVDLSLKWSVFGATGALTFQLITGLALYFLIRMSQGVK